MEFDLTQNLMHMVQIAEQNFLRMVYASPEDSGGKVSKCHFKIFPECMLWGKNCQHLRGWMDVFVNVQNGMRRKQTVKCSEVWKILPAWVKGQTNGSELFIMQVTSKNHEDLEYSRVSK